MKPKLITLKPGQMLFTSQDLRGSFRVKLLPGDYKTPVKTVAIFKTLEEVKAYHAKMVARGEKARERRSSKA